MTARKSRPALQSILAALAGIEDAVRDKSFADYQRDWLLRHGVQRGIEIVSEASRRVPERLRKTRPEIPWKQVMGIGNVLRHEYHDISDRVIWNVVQGICLRLELRSRRLKQRLRNERRPMAGFERERD